MYNHAHNYAHESSNENQELQEYFQQEALAAVAEKRNAPLPDNCLICVNTDEETNSQLKAEGWAYTSHSGESVEVPVRLWSDVMGIARGTEDELTVLAGSTCDPAVILRRCSLQPQLYVLADDVEGLRTAVNEFFLQCEYFVVIGEAGDELAGDLMNDTYLALRTVGSGGS